MKRILISVFSIFVVSSFCWGATDAPTITEHPTSLTITNGGTAAFNVAVSGTGPFTYQWQRNGTNIPPVIKMIAGLGYSTYSGDGGPGTNAALYYPQDVASDSAGNLFIADRNNNRIRKVDTNGIITTVAGNGVIGYGGDGGPATNANLLFPKGIALDNSGNLFIADSNNRIRKVDANGIITLVAGNGSGTYSGDGGPATQAAFFRPYDIVLDESGSLFIADQGNNRVRKVDTNGIVTTVAGTGTSSYSGDGSPATNAGLNCSGIALDGAGNLFIADQGNNRIRKVDANGIITTVAGSGISGYSGDGGPAIAAKLKSPQGIAFDSAGNLFIADTGNNTIRKVDANGIISTIAGNGTPGYSGDDSLAANATLNGPTSVTFDAEGNLVIVQFNYNLVSKLVLETKPKLTLPQANASKAGPYTVVISNAFGCVTSQVATLTVLVPPSINSQPGNQASFVGGTATFKVSASGTAPLSYFWFRDGNPISGATDSTYSFSNVQLSDTGARFTCLVSNLCGSITTDVATLSAAFPPTITQQPTAITLTNGGTAVFNVAVSGEGTFAYQWQLDGINLSPIITTVAGFRTNGYSGDDGFATSAKLSSPTGIALDGAGSFFIADSGNNRIRKVDTNRIITTVAGTGYPGYSGDGGPATSAQLNAPQRIAWDPAGNLFIADYGNNRIRRVDTNGIITTVAGNGTYGYSGDGGLATNAQLYCPRGVALGREGELYIADYGNNRIRKVDANGTITTVAGNGTNGFSGDGGPATSATLSGPTGITFDGAGNLHIADSGNRRIRKVDATGIITTFAGSGNSGYSGDGGSATNADFDSPEEIAFDRLGNALIADSQNNCIRQVDGNGIVKTVAGKGSFGYSGDGGPASDAHLNYPKSIALNTNGDLFIADLNNHRIRAVSFSSATTPKLILPNVSPGVAGDYSVVVSTYFGSLTSHVATLTVLVLPSIQSHPINRTVIVDGAATFTVSASGTEPLSYFWLRNGTPIPGASDSIYSIQNAPLSDSGALISCLITNICGSVTSKVATLTVGTMPKFVQEPTSLNISKGATAQLGVTVSGTGPLAYQWQLNGTNLRPIITTVAGGGTAPYPGDGGLATNSTLAGPIGLEVDAVGNLFIVDSSSSRVRKVDVNGIITTVAGNGTNGFSGDGGPATNAQLNAPQRIALDSAGNLFIADYGNNRIRKVDANGIITTVAGNGTNGFAGDGGPATGAELNWPCDVAFDGKGNLFIADTSNGRIRKVDTNGIITTFAGNGIFYGGGMGGPATNASLNDPRGIAFDGAGNLYIADSSKCCIYKVDTTGIISMVVGRGDFPPSDDGGPAIGAGLYCYDVASDSAGNYFIAEPIYGYSRIRKVDTYGIITTVAGIGASGFSGDGGPATSAKLFMPRGVALDRSGNLFIADYNNSRVRKVSYLSALEPTLKLPDVTLADAGDYSVIVTSPYGCITSSIVNLSISSVLPPQEFTGVLTQETNLALQFRGGTPSHPYILQMSTNLTPPVTWQALATNWTDTNGLWDFSVGTSDTNSPARFFRVLGE